MWFLALVFIAIPVVLVGWWLKLLYSNRNVPNPPSFGKCVHEYDSSSESMSCLTITSFSIMESNSISSISRTDD